MRKVSRILIVVSCALFAEAAIADWKDLPGIKTREATQKVQDRTSDEVDDKVDSTVNCIFNPTECARSLKSDDPPKSETTASDDDAGQGPPRPPSATKPKAGPPPPPSARVWFVDIGGGNTAEVDETELTEMIARGEVSRSTPVWTDTFGGAYKPAGEVSQLQNHFIGD